MTAFLVGLILGAILIIGLLAYFARRFPAFYKRVVDEIELLATRNPS
jgi:hypothetical protein